VAEIDALLRFCARSVSTPGGRRERLDRRARFEIASARHPVEHVAPLFVPQSVTIAAYLFGFVAGSAPIAYVHIVAVRATHRRLGLASDLYRHFASEAAGRGACAIKAITTPANTVSIAFHESLGMAATAVADYAGPGQDRVVLCAELGDGTFTLVGS
jgi:GNAT superfamily N-acetyltransferase